jgi:hypothetical protein
MKRRAMTTTVLVSTGFVVEVVESGGPHEHGTIAVGAGSPACEHVVVVRLRPPRARTDRWQFEVEAGAPGDDGPWRPLSEIVGPADEDAQTSDRGHHNPTLPSYTGGRRASAALRRRSLYGVSASSRPPVREDPVASSTHDANVTLGHERPRRALFTAAVVAALVFLAIWQTASLRPGSTAPPPPVGTDVAGTPGPSDQSSPSLHAAGIDTADSTVSGPVDALTTTPTSTRASDIDPATYSRDGG